MTPDLSARVEALFASGRVKRPDDGDEELPYLLWWAGDDWVWKATPNSLIESYTRRPDSIIFHALMLACVPAGGGLVRLSDGQWMLSRPDRTPIVNADPIEAMVEALENTP